MTEMREAQRCGVCGGRWAVRCERCNVAVCGNHQDERGHPCGPHGRRWFAALADHNADELYRSLPAALDARPVVVLDLPIANEGRGRRKLRLAYRPFRHLLTNLGVDELGVAITAELPDGDGVIAIARLWELLAGGDPLDWTEAIAGVVSGDVVFAHAKSARGGEVSTLLQTAFFRRTR